MLEGIDTGFFLLLLAIGVVGLLSVLPLKIQFAELTSSKTGADARNDATVRTLVRTFGMKLPLLVVAIGIGLWLASHLGLKGAPLLTGAWHGKEAVDFWNTIAVGIGTGLGVGVVVALLALLGTQQGGLDFYSIPLWKRQLAGLLYGGIVEELFFRFFLLALLAWAVGAGLGLATGPDNTVVFWTANIISALFFGLAHLPSVSALGSLKKKTAALTLLLNGLAGLVYGYLFWVYGIEAAMLAHASTHVALQTGMRLLLRLLVPRNA
jgi:membrane protease YdiL (CAAX protease family)